MSGQRFEKALATAQARMALAAVAVIEATPELAGVPYERQVDIAMQVLKAVEPGSYARIRAFVAAVRDGVQVDLGGVG